MPTGVPANQLTDDEKRALFLLSLAAIIHEVVPDEVNRADLSSANKKLFNTLYIPKTQAKPKRKKKGSDKAKAE